MAYPYLQSCLFMTPWTVAHQAPLSMGFPGKNTGMGCLLQRIFPNPGIKSPSLVSPAMQVDSLLLNHQGSPGGLPYPYLILNMKLIISAYFIGQDLSHCPIQLKGCWDV